MNDFACGSRKAVDLGTVISFDTDNISAFPATVERNCDGTFRIYYSIIYKGINAGSFNIGRADGDFENGFTPVTFKLSPEKVTDSEVPALGNIPDKWNPTQPVHIKLAENHYRLYFWAHCYEQGIVRYLAADSFDGINYNVIDIHKPIFYHYCDRACPMKISGVDGLAGLRSKVIPPAEDIIGTDELVCNDATTVYILPDGTFEAYSAAIISVDEKSPEYIPWDNCPGKRRIIRRWHSQDGLNFIADGTVLAQDEFDPPYLQFYYLSVRYRQDGSRDGIIGRYDVLAQTMDFERCRSFDGITWNRERCNYLTRLPHELGVYSTCNPFFDDGDRELMFYTSCNYIHNGKYFIGERLKGEVRCIAIPKGE